MDEKLPKKEVPQARQDRAHGEECPLESGMWGRPTFRQPGGESIQKRQDKLRLAWKGCSILMCFQWLSAGSSHSFFFELSVGIFLAKQQEEIRKSKKLSTTLTTNDREQKANIQQRQATANLLWGLLQFGCFWDGNCWSSMISCYNRIWLLFLIGGLVGNILDFFFLLMSKLGYLVTCHSWLILVTRPLVQ